MVYRHTNSYRYNSYKPLQKWYNAYQIHDRLRKPLEGSLIKKDAKKFIENDSSKHYRISTHPDFVTYERGDFLKHAEVEVREFAKKLPRNNENKWYNSQKINVERGSY